MTTTNETVVKRQQSLASCLTAIHGGPHFAGVQAYVKLQTKGLTLASYLNNPDVSDDDKLALADRIEDIVKNQKWDELPTPPSGQASAPKAVVEVKPVAAAPKPVVAAPKPVTPQLAPPLPPSAYTPAVIEAAQPKVPSPIANDPMAMMAAAMLPHLLPHLPKQSNGEADLEVIRGMISVEMAAVFMAIGKGVAA